MTFRSAPLIAGAFALALPASAQETSRPEFWDLFSLENFGVIALNSMMGTARALADIRYDQVSIDPVAMRATLTGVTIAPMLPGLAPDACTAVIDRVTVNGLAIDRISDTQIRIALDGLGIDAGCLPFEIASLMRGLGFASLRAPRAELEVRYNFASGGAQARLDAEFDKLAAISAVADVDYLSYRMDFTTEEPTLSIDLNTAQVSIEDRGGWDIAKKFMPPGLLNPDALKQIVTEGLQQALLQANLPQDSDLSAAQRAFALEAGRLAAEFDAGRRQIVLSTQPQSVPVRLNEQTADSFRQMFDQLAPTLATTPPAIARALSVAELDAALNAETPPDNAFDLGRALITGLGAPRNASAGLKLLVPLARAGNAEASLLIAAAIESTLPADAYSHALRASAAGLPGALALLDRIERTLPYDNVIATQNQQMEGPDPALYADLGAMRSAARGFLIGTTRPRSWRAAYYWASMAAAAGDPAAAALRDEVTETLRLRGDAVAWAKESESLDNGVLRDWIGRDVPAQLR